MSKRVVISFANNARYSHCIKRMEKYLNKYSGFDIKHWINVYPPGSPQHSENPYAFKAYAFKWANDNGYDSALWLDSAVWPNKDPNIIFDEIENIGYWICLNGWSQANWSTNEQLKYYKVTRDEANKMQHAMACILGFSFRHDIGKQAYNEYLQAAKDGIFRGSWTNKNGEISSDKRVLGSRHDQTCLGFIVNKLGLQYKIKNVEYIQPGRPPKDYDILFYTCAGILPEDKIR